MQRMLTKNLFWKFFTLKKVKGIRSNIYYRVAVPKNLVKFTRKHLRHIIFFNKKGLHHKYFSMHSYRQDVFDGVYFRIFESGIAATLFFYKNQ